MEGGPLEAFCELDSNVYEGENAIISYLVVLKNSGIRCTFLVFESKDTLYFRAIWTT